MPHPKTNRNEPVSQILLIRISGEDKPGLFATLMRVFAQAGVKILDIGQAVVHRTLSLGVMVQLPDNLTSDQLIGQTEAQVEALGLRARFDEIPDEEYNGWVARRGRAHYIVTLIGREIGPDHLDRVCTVLLEEHVNIDVIQRLSGRIPMDQIHRQQRACMELRVSSDRELDMRTMEATFMEITKEAGIDIALQRDTLFRRNRRLVVFDMDSTLIQHEVIDELAIEAGVGAQVAAITESAMRGELDFQQSFRRRLALLEGLEESALQRVAARLRLTEGCERLFANLKQLGYKTAIVSGGFGYFGRILQKQLGVDYVHANELEFVDGKLTGKPVGAIIDGARKAELLRQIADQERLNLEQVIAVGDGANDLPMLGIAGLGIAFHAKPLVKQSARHSISTLGLDSILYLIGMRDFETFEAGGGTQATAN